MGRNPSVHTRSHIITTTCMRPVLISCLLAPQVCFVSVAYADMSLVQLISYSLHALNQTHATAAGAAAAAAGSLCERGIC
jgi:hypothetical protein